MPIDSQGDLEIGEEKIDAAEAVQAIRDEALEALSAEETSQAVEEQTEIVQESAKAEPTTQDTLNTQ